MEFVERYKKLIIDGLKREPWWAELWSAIAVIAWTVASNNSTHLTYYHPANVQLELIRSKLFWEASGIAIGIFQLISVVNDKIIYRWTAALIVSWWWMFLVVAILKNDVNPPGLTLYFVFVAINLFSMIKLSRTL